MTRPRRSAFPGAIDHMTSRGNARAAIYADAADHATWLILFTGRDQVTLADKERAFSALSTWRRMLGLSYNVPIVPTADAVHAMAKLPNGERAPIPMEKLTDYCLNPDHPRGKDQARVFAAVLGITRDRANELAALVRQAAMEGDITKEARTVFGRYYRVDWAIPTRGNAVLRTMWDIAPGEEVPRLIAAFMRS